MKRLWLVFAIICFALAAFFALALIGYIFTAGFFACAGVLIIIFHLLRRYEKRGLRTALIVLICLGLAAFILVEIPIVRASRGDEDRDCEYLVVLGAGVNGTVPSLSMVNRLSAALDYMQRHPDCTVIVSGGQGPGEDISEAQAMAGWLTARGIAGERIVLEDRATSTWENLSYSKELILQREGELVPIAIVSSEYHLYRAEYMARQLGMEAAGVPGHTSYTVLRLNYFLREAFAVTYMWVFG